MSVNDNFYVDNERFHELLVLEIPHYKEHRRWGKYGNELGKIIMDMMEKIKNRSSYKNYNGYHWEKMQEKALVNVFSYMHKYNIDTKNPFNYFSTVIINGYRTALREMNERPTEVTYDNEVLTEIIDLDNCVKFEDDVITEADKRPIEKIYVKTEDTLVAMGNMLLEMDDEYKKDEILDKMDGNVSEEDL